MRKLLLGIVIGLGVTISGFAFASRYFVAPLWDNSYTDNSGKNIPATAQVDSFTDKANTCYVLQNPRFTNYPIGISCVKN